MNSTATTPPEPLYVTDTNALIWYLTKNKMLGKRAREIYEATATGDTQIVISAVTMAELYYSNAKHGWFSDFATVYADLRANPRFQFEDFRVVDVPQFDRDAAVPEMHDRIIVGLARRLGAPLIASDPLIVQAGIVRIEW